MSLDSTQAIVGTDSMEVVCLLNSQDARSHQYEQVVTNILHLQAAHGAIVFHHTPRVSNSLADYLAKTWTSSMVSTSSIILLVNVILFL